jgi:PBSX family phage terminase large subunit
MTSERTINIDDYVCDNMRDVVASIVQCNFDRVVLKGGRNSTKSQVCATSIVVGCMTYKASAVALVKIANKIEERLVNTFKFSINMLGVSDMWKLRKSPSYEYVLLDVNGKETDVSIKFTGCEDPELLKSYKPRSGSFRYVWIEETSNFKSMAEVNSVAQTMARGTGKHTICFSYNPPKAASNWCNKEWENPKHNVLYQSEDNRVFVEEIEVDVQGMPFKQTQLVHTSDYLDVIRSGHADWLGDTFIAEAEKCRIENPVYYDWCYLGKVGASQANVFSNVRDWNSVVPEESKQWTRVHYRGFDFGYGGPDSNAFVEWVYDEKNKYLFLFSHFGKPAMTLTEIANNIRKKNPKGFLINADSANPLLIDTVNNDYLHAFILKKTPKPHGSVEAGITWLQSLNGIFIDPVRNPEVYNEFKGYEYMIINNEVTSKLPDANNHYIDATRYAMYEKIKFG